MKLISEKRYAMLVKETTPDNREHFATDIIGAIGEMSAFAKARGKIRSYEAQFPKSTFELISITETTE
jgi:hypothetical protein